MEYEHEDKRDEQEKMMGDAVTSKKSCLQGYDEFSKEQCWSRT